MPWSKLEDYVKVIFVFNIEMVNKKWNTPSNHFCAYISRVQSSLTDDCVSVKELILPLFWKHHLHFSCFCLMKQKLDRNESNKQLPVFTAEIIGCKLQGFFWGLGWRPLSRTRPGTNRDENKVDNKTDKSYTVMKTRLTTAFLTLNNK